MRSNARATSSVRRRVGAYTIVCPSASRIRRRRPANRARFAGLRRRIREADGHTIVYAPTRRLTELVARALLRMGVRAAPYHAGLSAGTRRQVLLEFLRDRVPVVVATSAFGMGIDKPDVRLVLHW